MTTSVLNDHYFNNYYYCVGTCGENPANVNDDGCGRGVAKNRAPTIKQCPRETAARRFFPVFLLTGTRGAAIFGGRGEGRFRV